MNRLISYSVHAALMVAAGASGTALAQTAAKSDTEATGLEEVVVTATKRSENLIKVPVTVNVLTAKDIEAQGIVRSSDFLGSTPNVTFMEDNTGETFINIRGQTSSRNSDPNVAIVVDGVTLSSVRDFNQDLFDLEQVEILKGPQSALYGRNAAAGAIVITTKEPSLDATTGSLTVGKGNFNSTRMVASMTGPITSDLAYRASISFRDTDGPFTNSTSGEKVDRTTPTLGRLRFLYRPNEKLSVDFKVGFESTHGGTLSYQADLGALNTNNADRPWVTNIVGVYKEKYYDATLKIDYDLGFGKFTSISSANYLDNFYGGALPPYFPCTDSSRDPTVNTCRIANYAFKDKNYSQEFRLTSNSDQKFRWQAGIYYLKFLRSQFNETNLDTLGVVPGTYNVIDGPDAPEPTMAFNNQRYTTESWAPFASIQYDILDSLHLSLAGRYDHEKRTVAEVETSAINPMTGVTYNLCIQMTGRALADCHDGTTFKQFEPKASLAFDVSQNASVYVSWGKGFKSGGFNPIGARGALVAANGGSEVGVFVQDQYDKEVSKSYEVGAKMRFFDHRLSINAAAFKTDISGAQQFQFVPTIGLQTTVSIDKVVSKGFDVDFQALLPTGTTLFGGYGKTDAKVDEFFGNPSYVGNKAPGTYAYTANLGVSQKFVTGPNTTLIPRVEVNRYGDIWQDAANTPGTMRDPLTLLKARITLASNDDKWSVSAYGDNLTNRIYYQQSVVILPFFSVNYRGWTRTFGVEGTIKF